MQPYMQEPLAGLFTKSRLMILDFAKIPSDTPRSHNIHNFFIECEQQGLNPRAPEHRQVFNSRVLEETHSKYLVSQYAEDRQAMLVGSSIAAQKRTLHLGVDIFCRARETVFAPCDGEIIRIGNEPEDHSFGHYIILKPDASEVPFIFFGHLAPPSCKLGRVSAGEPIGLLGDFRNGENGGWSIHLHLQMLRRLPPIGEVPLGYSTKAGFAELEKEFPNPLSFFPNWRIQE